MHGMRKGTAKPTRAVEEVKRLVKEDPMGSGMEDWRDAYMSDEEEEGSSADEDERCEPFGRAALRAEADSSGAAPPPPHGFCVCHDGVIVQARSLAQRRIQYKFS